MTTIVSGGQTGVDRAALDVARTHGIRCGGWCPRGGWAEDLPEPPGLLARYPELRETPNTDPSQRTEWNVRDSTATLVITTAGALTTSEGTALAVQCARRLARPHLVVDVGESAAAPRVASFVGSLPADAVLNVAGPRESESPGIYDSAVALLERAAPLFA